MSINFDSQNNTNKEEIKKPKEADSLYQIDLQILSSLKPIPGKIISLNNNMNQISNNKENNKDMNIKDSFYNFNKNDPINNINCIYNNDKMNINNKIINNNNFTGNNYIFNRELNNSYMNFSPFNYQNNSFGLFQNSFPAFDNQILFPSSNNPSLLSIKSDIKNNNYLFSDNKLTQNSFTHNIFLYNNDNYNLKENLNINNIINNNLKISQQSYQCQNFGNEEVIKKKKSTSMLIRQNSDNSNLNSEIKNKLISYEINDNFEKKNSDKIKKIHIKENNINDVKNETKNENNNNISQNKTKKIFFNIESYSDEKEDDTIYQNVSNNKNDPNNLFNCFSKKKRKRKKINEIYKYKCSHPKCEYSYKTIKQLQNHHYKMTQECQLDSIEIIKMIKNSKNLLKNIIENNKNKREKFEKLYDDFVNKISLKNYFEFFAGSHFNDDK